MSETTAQSSASHARVQALDLLRLFAALAVVSYHYSFRGASADGMTWLSLPAVVPVTKYGFLGVQLFFVISGFVIAYSAEGRTVRQFFIARFARIYPGFLACMTLTFLVLFFLGPPEATVSPIQWLANLVIVSPALKQPFVDGVYWSIVYELVFYAWIAGLIAGGFFPRRLPAFVAGWLVLSLANDLFLDIGALRRVLLTDDSGFFAAGIMLYVLHSGRRTIANYGLLAAAVAVAVLQGNWGADWVRDHFSIVLSPVAVGAISVTAVALVAACLFIRRLPLSAGAILAIGGLTYPLYLIHQMAGFAIFNRLAGIASAPVLAPAVLALMLAVAFLVYRYVERPGQRATKRLLDRFLPGAKRAASPREVPIRVFGPVRIPRAVTR